MPPPAIEPLPDIEHLLVTYLAAQFPSMRFCTDFPATITEVTARVARIAGAGRNWRVDRPVVDIDVLAPTQDAAVLAARQIQVAVVNMRNVVTADGVVQSAATAEGPRWLPELNPGLVRYSATYLLHTHALTSA